MARRGQLWGNKGEIDLGCAGLRQEPTGGQSQGLSRDDPATVGNMRQRLDVLGRQSPGVLLACRA